MGLRYDVVFVVSNQDQAGKSTFARALAEELTRLTCKEVKICETGSFIDEVVARYKTAVEGYKTIQGNLNWLSEKCQSVRNAKRAMADELCRVNPAWMVDKAVESGARIVVGCRRSSEIGAWASNRVVRAGLRSKIYILFRVQEDVNQTAADFFNLGIDATELLNDGSVEELIEVAKMEAAKIAWS